MSYACNDCKDEGYRRVLHRGYDEYHRVRCHCQEDLPVKVVVQPENSGCALAAIATIAGKTYDEVRQRIHLDRDFTVDGTYDSEIESLLHLFGFAWQCIGRVDPRLSTARPTWPPVPWAPIHLAKVLNLRNSGLHLVVVLEDGRVLDPHFGVIQGLHRYPRVDEVWGIWPLSGFVASPPTLVSDTEPESERKDPEV